MAFDAGKIEASLDLDRSPFQRNLREAKAEARQFADAKYAATLDADTGEALAKVIDIRDRLDRLSAKRVTPSIDLDGFAEAEAKVTVLEHQLDRLDRKTGGGAGGGGVLGRLASFGRGGFFGGMGLLGVAGGAAAIPFGIGAAGLGASFLTPTVAGAAGLGLFGAASKSAIERVAKEQKQLDALNQRIANTPATNPGGNPQQIAAAQARLTAAQTRLTQVQNSDTGTPAQIAAARASVLSAQSSLSNAQGGGPNAEHARLVKQRQQLLDQLTPAEQRAAEGIENFEHAWKRFQRALEPETFRLLATGTDIFTKGLHLLLPMTKAVGDEVDNLAVRADRALSKPFWRHFFGDFLTREAPRAVDTLGTVLGNVVTGLAHLSEDFAPLGHRLEDDVIRWSGIFDRWTQGSGPAEFVALVERDGPIAAQALSALAHGLGGLAAGLEPIGRIELQALTPVLTFVGDLGRQHPEVITALGVAYLSVAGGLKAIAAVKGLSEVLGLARGIGTLGRGGGLGGVLGRVAEPIPVYVTNWGGLPGGGKDPVPGPAGARGTRRLLPGLGTLGLAYIATQGGDEAPGQNGPAYGSPDWLRAHRGAANALALIQNPQGDAAHDFPKSVWQGDTINVPKAAQFLMGNGSPEQIRQLKELAKTYPAVEAGIEAYNKQQRDLNQLLGITPDRLRSADGATKHFTTSLLGLSAAAGQVDADLGHGLIARIEAYTPHATVAGKLRVSSTAKATRLGVDADSRAVGRNGGGGVTNYYDLRGSKIEAVKGPHDLERQLRAKQRLSSLGPGISVDNANRIG